MAAGNLEVFRTLLDGCRVIAIAIADGDLVDAMCSTTSRSSVALLGTAHAASRRPVTLA
jgi:hypothetical protein